MDVLDYIFARCSEVNFQFRAGKCHFLALNMEYLGRMITPQGITTLGRLTSAIRDAPTPKDRKQVKSFLGLSGFYRKFMKNYSTAAFPMQELTKLENPFVWSAECQISFEVIKGKLISNPVLAFPNFNKQFHLTTDASQFGLGAVLSQFITIKPVSKEKRVKEEGHEEEEHPMAYGSRGLQRYETHYITTELECLAVVWAILRYKIYLISRPFVLYSDHEPLKWLMHKHHKSGRLIRWNLCLQEFSFVVVHKRGIDIPHADALSRPPIISCFILGSNTPKALKEI